MKGHIILLNAPAGAGKNTIARELTEVFGMVEMQFKSPMYKIASAMVGLSVEQFLEFYADREKKEKPCEEFLGMSGRQLLIDISESFCKPRFGDEYFGRVAANSMNRFEFETYGYVFSDSGFISEVRPLARKFGAGNVTIVQFTGQGVNDFGNDSRTWVDGTDIGVATVRLTLPNSQVSPEDYAKYVIESVRSIK